MKNILIITYTLTAGGAEKLAANLSLELSKYANVYVVTYEKRENEYSIAGTRINLNLRGRTFLDRVLCSMKRIKVVRKIKKKYNIDYSISFVPPTDYVNILSKRKGEKVLIDVVSNMSVVYPGGLKKAWRKYILKKADYVVTVSEGVRKDLIDNFGIEKEKSKTIYNSCDIKNIEEECLKDDIFIKHQSVLPTEYICTMGSFRHPKGHWHLIKAFSTIANEIPNISLVILGDGEYREKYLELINILGLQERVVMPGFINPPFSVIAHSRLFVFSSVFEGFGHSVIEAMACNVPVLSTDCKYGPREMLAPGTDLGVEIDKCEIAEYGVLLPAFDCAEMIDVSEKISDKEKIMGQAMLEMLRNKEMCEDYAAKGLTYSKKFDNALYCQQWINVMDGM